MLEHTVQVAHASSSSAYCSVELEHITVTCSVKSPEGFVPKNHHLPLFSHLNRASLFDLKAP